jgi:hypothetical protein
VSVNKIISVERHRIKMMENLIPISDNYKERFYSLIGIKGENVTPKPTD